MLERCKSFHPILYITNFHKAVATFQQIYFIYLNKDLNQIDTDTFKLSSTLGKNLRLNPLK